MAESRRDVSVGQSTGTMGVWRPLFKKAVLWVIELAIEALGTCFVLIAISFLDARHEQPPLHNDLTLQMVLGITFFILVEFGMTGYVVTTAIARVTLGGARQRLYPYVCAALYLAHSTIFFVSMGNSPFRVSDLAIQFIGACVTMGCARISNRLFARWTEGKGNLGFHRFPGR